MRKFVACALSGVTGVATAVIAALALAVPAAHADPDVVPPPVPLPAEQSINTQAAAGDPALQPPPAEVPHLSSPENLPPGTTDTPLDRPQGRTTSYLRDLWHAMQTQEISGRDALLLLTQRPLDPNAVPFNGLAPGPQAPAPAEPAPAEPAPADAAPAPLLPGVPPPPAALPTP